LLLQAAQWLWTNAVCLLAGTLVPHMPVVRHMPAWPRAAALQARVAGDAATRQQQHNGVGWVDQASCESTTAAALMLASSVMLSHLADEEDMQRLFWFDRCTGA
jgi:hypothetical protein